MLFSRCLKGKLCTGTIEDIRRTIADVQFIERQVITFPKEQQPEARILFQYFEKCAGSQNSVLNKVVEQLNGIQATEKLPALKKLHKIEDLLRKGRDSSTPSIQVREKLWELLKNRFNHFDEVFDSLNAKSNTITVQIVETTATEVEKALCLTGVLHGQLLKPNNL
jgi:hypothetical protein